MGNQDQYTSNTTNATNATNANGAGNAAPNTAASANATPSNGAEDMLCLMEQNQKTCMLGQWMRCMRKPALSVQYTLEKRHIPDMDNDPAGKIAGQASGGKSGAGGKGSNADTVSVTGGFTIRYFDLAAGAMTLLLAGCMIKALCCVRKLM